MKRCFFFLSLFAILLLIDERAVYAQTNVISTHGNTITNERYEMREHDRESGFENEMLSINDEQENTTWYKEMKLPSANLHYAEREFRKDKSRKNQSPSVPLTRQEREFLLWLAKNRGNANADGILLTPTEDSTGVQKFLTANVRKANHLQGTAAWKPLGPFTWDKDARLATGSQGTGVVRSVALNPTNPNIIVAGTISAGVWHSSNGGASWTETTRSMLCKYVGGVAFAPSNPSTVYAGTNVGVLKSTTGGTSWSYTALNSVSSYPSGTSCDLVAVAPTNANLVLANRGSQLMRSSDGGSSWNPVTGWSNETWSLSWHPTNSSIVYASAMVANSWIEFRRSIDGGLTWTSLTNGYPTVTPNHSLSRAIIAVTPAAPENVYVMIGGSNGTNAGMYGLYVSRNAGSSFEHLCCGVVNGPEPSNETTNPNIFDYSITGNGLGQITWDMGFAVSTTDTNLIVASGIFSYRSTNAGRSFQPTPPIHYDVQCLAIHGNTVFVATDGGMYFSKDRYETISFSSGICSLEMWGFDVSHKGNIMVAGAYHIPIYFRDDSVYSGNGYEGGWYMWSGADAMGANVNQADSRWMYSKPWGNARSFRYENKLQVPSSSDLGLDLGYITKTNLDYHPHLYYTIVGCDYTKKAFMRSLDNAATWDTMKVFVNSVRRIRTSVINKNIMVGIADNAVWRTTNGGVTWVNITPATADRAGQGLNDIALSDSDDNILWLSLGGHQNTRKVLMSTNGGVSWLDYSGSLPKTAIRTMCYQRGTNGGIYLGTEMGVYYRNLAMSDWELHGTQLPVGEVAFLKVSYEDAKLRAGTERGIWENELYEPSLPKAHITADRNQVSCYRNPIRFADLSIFKRSNLSTVRWLFEGGTPSSSSDENPLVSYSKKGTYSVTLTISENGVENTQTLKDFITVGDDECSVSSNAGGAILLGDSLDYVSVPPLSAITNNITFSAWVKPNGIQRDWSPIIQSDQAAGFAFKNGRNELGYHWQSGSNYSWNSGLIVPADQWSHVAMTVTPDSVTLYLNGVPSVHRIKSDPVDFSTNIVRIGQDRNWNQSRNYNGEIDEICIYNRALTTEEIRLGMHLTRSADDTRLLAYYQFNEPSGNLVYDTYSGKDASIIGKAIRNQSSAPLGGGTSVVLTAEQLNRFTSTTLGTDVALRNNDAVNNTLLVTKITTSPYTMPANAPRFTPHWWILRSWNIATKAESVLAVDSLRLFTGDISDNDARLPNTLRLYQRRANEFIPDWELCQATLADSVTNSAVFRLCVNDTLGQLFTATMGDSPLNISEPSSVGVLQLRVYPNPTTDVITVVLDESITAQKVEILTSLGTILESKIVEGTLAMFDVSNYPQGLYIIRSGRYIGKVIK